MGSSCYHFLDSISGLARLAPEPSLLAGADRTFACTYGFCDLKLTCSYRSSSCSPSALACAAAKSPQLLRSFTK